MNKHSILSAKAFYIQALLAWLCLVPAVWVFRYLALFAEEEMNFLLRMVLYVFVISIGEIFHQQPAYFAPNYTLYRYWYVSSSKPLSRKQFYSRVVAYYLLVIAGVAMLFRVGEWLNYNVLYFYLIFVFVVLSLYYADNYLIPSYSRYKRLLSRRTTA